MITMLEKVQEAQSVDEMCVLFGEYLGLNGPVPLAILRRAIEEDLFAHRLITARNYHYMLEVLFNDPHNREYELREVAKKRSNLKLVAKATESLVRWGKAGFSQVDQATFEYRFGACQTCEQLVDPPDQLIYKVTLSKRHLSKGAKSS